MLIGLFYCWIWSTDTLFTSIFTAELIYNFAYLLFLWDFHINWSYRTTWGTFRLIRMWTSFIGVSVAKSYLDKTGLSFLALLKSSVNSGCLPPPLDTSWGSIFGRKWSIAFKFLNLPSWCVAFTFYLGFFFLFSIYSYSSLFMLRFWTVLLCLFGTSLDWAGIYTFQGSCEGTCYIDFYWLIDWLIRFYLFCC